MSAFYSDLAKLALDMLTEFGQPVSIQQEGTKVVKPNGVTVPSNPAPMTTKGVLFDFVLKSDGTNMMVETYVQSADKNLFMAPTIYPPQPQDRVTVGGHVWTIVNIKEINPAGTIVLYELWLKR